MNANKTAARDTIPFQTAGTLLRALFDWSSVPENFPYGLAALILNYVLFQAELVPRWLSGWGLVGSVLMLVMGFLRLYGHAVVYLAIPLILNEIALAVWLLVVGIDSYATASAIVGILLITALAATTLSGSFLGAKDGPDYLAAVSANESRVLTGILFQLILTASVVAIPIVMFPILREYSESLALGYVVARIFEGFFDTVMALSLLLLVTLSREFVKAGPPAEKEDVNELE